MAVVGKSAAYPQQQWDHAARPEKVRIPLLECQRELEDPRYEAIQRIADKCKTVLWNAERRRATQLR